LQSEAGGKVHFEEPAGYSRADADEAAGQRAGLPGGGWLLVSHPTVRLASLPPIKK